MWPLTLLPIVLFDGYLSIGKSLIYSCAIANNGHLFCNDCNDSTSGSRDSNHVEFSTLETFIESNVFGEMIFNRDHYSFSFV